MLKMGSCLLFLILMQMGKHGFSQTQEGKGKEECLKTVINSCSDCISSGQYCLWCKQLNFTKTGEQETVRCDTRSQLEKRGCMPDQIISPVNFFRVEKETPLSSAFNQENTQQEAIQLTPQEVLLRLRPGKPSTFTLSFKRVEGYPVDLYYLMDLSYSMEDDLRNIKSLGTELFKALKTITEHAQIGFGTFVDKTVLPFTNTNKKKLEKPCDKKEKNCQPAFGYRHVLSMTADETRFDREVKKQNISGNLDSPEGSLDAMMQAVVCGSKIGWRNSSTRLIVLTTDAGFHMAGDGKLAGILQPNDEQCHLERNINAMNNKLDYPSVGQLAMQLEKNNIQPIFAVTKDVIKVYKELSKMIPKSEVEELSPDSKNIVSLIKNAYNRLSSKVTMAHDDLPEHVTVTYTPICQNGGPAGEAEGVCNDVGVGEKVSFNVTVTADKCMAQQSFTISPLGIKDTLKVTVSTKCNCECDDPPGIHTQCNSKGEVECGICRCSQGFVGQKCECAVGDKDESALRASCRRENGTECEGRGICVCGRCSCNPTDSGTSYHGKYCQCDDDHCEKFVNKLCGGNGRCLCGKCICNPGYEGSACHCKMSNDSCRLPGETNNVCNGRGTCRCNQCDCKNNYEGPFCQVCHGCPDPCQTKQKCIECLFQMDVLGNCSAACTDSVKHKMVDMFTMTKKPCKMKDSEGCWITFKLEQQVGEDNYTAEILRSKECPELPNIFTIVGGSIGGGAFIGLVIMLLVKLFIYLKDKEEFKKFETEKGKATWAKATNPLFKDATTTVANPTYTGE